MEMKQGNVDINKNKLQAARVSEQGGGGRARRKGRASRDPREEERAGAAASWRVVQRD